MSDNPVQRTNLAAITCDPRPQLPDGFRRNSTRVGAALGAARTGLSVYALGAGADEFSVVCQSLLRTDPRAHGKVSPQ